MRKFHVPAHFRSFPSIASIQADGWLFAGTLYGGLEPAITWLGHGLVAGGPGAGFCFLRAQPDISGRWVPACVGVAVGCGNFLYPAYFRSFPSVASIQADGRLFTGTRYGGLKPALTWLGHGLVAGGPGPVFCFCGRNRTFPGAGLVPACAGVAVGCGNFIFPIISDHFRSFPSVASIQAGAGCSLGAVPGTRLGGCRPWAGFWFLRP